MLDQDRNGIHQLKRLDLERSLNYPENLHFLLQSTALQSLQYLNLSNCNLNDEYVRDLFNSDLMLTIEYLRLANNKLTAEALPVKIVSRDKRSRDSEIALKFLDLRYNPIIRDKLRTREYLNTVMILCFDIKKKVPFKPNDKLKATEHLPSIVGA